MAKWGLQLNGLISQGYDGAANMLGKLNGVQAAVLEEYPKACYTHCCTHCSHPVISTACANNATNNNAKKLYKIFTSSTFSPAARSEVACWKNAISTMIPFSRSSKFVALCETRGAERYEAVIVFIELFAAMLHALQEIEISDALASVNAEGLKPRTLNPDFIYSLKIFEHIFAMTLPLWNRKIQIYSLAVKWSTISRFKFSEKWAAL